MMNIQIEKKYLPTDENTGKCYIDPDSTQVFIEALIKEKQKATDNETSNDTFMPEHQDTSKDVSEDIIKDIIKTEPANQ